LLFWLVTGWNVGYDAHWVLKEKKLKRKKKLNFKLKIKKEIIISLLLLKWQNNYFEIEI